MYELAFSKAQRPRPHQQRKRRDDKDSSQDFVCLSACALPPGSAIGLSSLRRNNQKKPRRTTRPHLEPRHEGKVSSPGFVCLSVCTLPPGSAIDLSSLHRKLTRRRLGARHGYLPAYMPPPGSAIDVIRRPHRLPSSLHATARLSDRHVRRSQPKGSHGARHGNPCPSSVSDHSTSHV